MRCQDADWVRRAREGGKDCFAQLVRRYRDAVYGLAYHRLGDFSAAEDVTQDAFVRAYERLHELREAGKFAPWLLSIARNLCNQHLRSRRQDEPSAPVEPSTDGVERQAVTRDLVHRALSILPPENGLAITLYYVNGYSYAEIAALLEVPPSTVRGRLARGRSQMQEEMVTMMRDRLGENKPGDGLTEMVIRRISAQEVWRLGPRQAECAHLGHSFLLIDGELARCRFHGLTGTTALQAEAEIRSHDRESPLCVFSLWSHPNSYYVFGKAKVEPDGPVVENQMLHVEVRVTPAGPQEPRLEPWEPERVESARLWAMPPQERDPFLLGLHQRSGEGVMLDGGLAHACLVNGAPGSGTCSGGREVYLWNRGKHALNVYGRTWPQTQYYVFGEAQAVPPGLHVTDGIVQMQAVVEGPVGPPDAEGHAPIPEFSSAELWRLDCHQQSERLGDSEYARIDGYLCSAKVTGGHGTKLVGTVPIATETDETMALYRLVGDGNRYYLFGAATLPAEGQHVADEVLVCKLAVQASGAGEPDLIALPELSAETIRRMSPSERDASLSCGAVILDGGLAQALLLRGERGDACYTPGEEVAFRSVGDHSLFVYRWLWPRPRYYVFGQADVTPPGIRVTDSTVVLEARVVSR